MHVKTPLCPTGLECCHGHRPRPLRLSRRPMPRRAFRAKRVSSFASSARPPCDTAPFRHRSPLLCRGGRPMTHDEAGCLSFDTGAPRSCRKGGRGDKGQLRETRAAPAFSALGLAAGTSSPSASCFRPGSPSPRLLFSPPDCPSSPPSTLWPRPGRQGWGAGHPG